MKSWLLFAMIVGLYVLHQDVWNWRQVEPLVLGWMPVGLWYHVGFSFAAAGAMAILVKFAWPKDLEEEPVRIPSQPSDDSRTRGK